MSLLLSVFLLLFPYLLGSISAAVVVSKYLFKVDIRTQGSQNAGSTNMFRVLGFKAGVLTQAFDIGKGALAAALPYFAFWWFPDTQHAISHLDLELQSILCGMLAVIGHIYPVFFGFRGGKGINTLLGMMAVTNWVACLVCLVGWILVLYLTRFVSISSMVAVLCYPLFLVVASLLQCGSPDWLLVGAGFGMFLLVVYTHRSNITRLLAGTEGRNPWFDRKGRKS